jgi:hypothetical protein
MLAWFSRSFSPKRWYVSIGPAFACVYRKPYPGLSSEESAGGDLLKRVEQFLPHLVYGFPMTTPGAIVISYFYKWHEIRGAA